MGESLGKPTQELFEIKLKSFERENDRHATPSNHDDLLEKRKILVGEIIGTSRDYVTRRNDPGIGGEPEGCLSFDGTG
jgi:hypothetical protein